MTAMQRIEAATSTPEDRALTLEAIIDRDGILATLASLEAIAHGKADHVTENWGDDTLARAWDRMGAKFGAMRDSMQVQAIARTLGETIAQSERGAK